jgi:nitrate/TMAO reductase-like tetraheme cytochrome c subunit
VIYWVLAVGAGVLVVLLLVLRRTMKSLATRPKRVLAFLAMAVFSILWLAGMMGYADHEFKKVSFCTQCHEMREYGEGLTVEDESLAAMHFRNDFVDRETACYECHTRPGLSGLLEAKKKGLHNAYAHYLGEFPEELELHGEYDTHICLKCHGEAQSFLQGWGHQAILEELQSGETSCLKCHDVAHELDG